MQRIELFEGSIGITKPVFNTKTSDNVPDDIMNPNGLVCLIPMGIAIPEYPKKEDETWEDYIGRVFLQANSEYFEKVPSESSYMEIFAIFTLGIKKANMLEYIGDNCWNGSILKIGNTWFFDFQ